jgi:hypothetical protein
MKDTSARNRLLGLLKKPILLLLPAFVLFAVALRRSVPPEAEVSFAGYTDEYGGYRLGHFRITNHTSDREFVCYQGPVNAQIQGRWIVDTERLGRCYNTVIESGNSLVIPVYTPKGAKLWSSSFTLRDCALRPVWQRKGIELLRRRGINWFSQEREFVLVSEKIPG